MTTNPSETAPSRSGATEPSPPTPRPGARRAATVVMGLGFALILSGVFYLLAASNGPGRAPRTFAERRSYNLVKVDLHRAMPVGFSLGFGGLLVVIAGKRWRDRTRSQDNSTTIRRQ